MTFLSLKTGVKNWSSPLIAVASSPAANQPASQQQASQRSKASMSTTQSTDGSGAPHQASPQQRNKNAEFVNNMLETSLKLLVEVNELNHRMPDNHELTNHGTKNKIFWEALQVLPNPLYQYQALTAILANIHTRAMTQDQYNVETREALMKLFALISGMVMELAMKPIVQTVDVPSVAHTQTNAQPAPILAPDADPGVKQEQYLLSLSEDDQLAIATKLSLESSDPAEPAPAAKTQPPDDEDEELRLAKSLSLAKFEEESGFAVIRSQLLKAHNNNEQIVKYISRVAPVLRENLQHLSVPRIKDAFVAKQGCTTEYRDCINAAIDCARLSNQDVEFSHHVLNVSRIAKNAIMNGDSSEFIKAVISLFPEHEFDKLFTKYASGTSSPASSVSAPNTGYPAPNTGYPAPNTGYPAPNTGYPAPNTGYPAPNTGYPAPNRGLPAALFRRRT